MQLLEIIRPQIGRDGVVTDVCSLFSLFFFQRYICFILEGRVTEKERDRDLSSAVSLSDGYNGQNWVV